MEEIYFGTTNGHSGNGKYGVLHIKDDELPQGHKGFTIEHLKIYLGTLVAHYRNPVHYNNGMEGDLLHPLSGSELEQIVSEPHFGRKVEERFVNDGILPKNP